MSDDGNDRMFSTVTPYLRYPDGDAAAAWLRRVFGFGPAEAARDGNGRWYEGHIAAGPVRIAISDKGGADTDGGAYLIIGVRDADEMYRRIRAAGVETDPPVDKPYGPRSVSTTDPWGNTWDFWQGEAKM
ncbi:hypothetical protein GCM10027570_48910 [Streptomonospora sediminis]